MVEQPWKSRGMGRKSNETHVQEISHNVYVSNFPSHFSSRELWNTCDKFGTVMDVFIPTRRSKNGQMFAFVRYKIGANIDLVVSKLCNTWIGKLRLNANVARFGRNSKVKNLHVWEEKQGAFGCHAESTRLGARKRTDLSYAKVVEGVQKGSGFEIKGDVVAIVLDMDGPAKTNYPLALIGCVKEFRSLPNLRNLCKGEGFVDIDFKYIGGLWVLMDFSSVDSREKFNNHTGINSWFQELLPWTREFIVKERLIWVDVEGVPISAWDLKAFKNIVRKWGDIVYHDLEDGNNLFSTRLCIKSSHGFGI